MPSVRRQLLKHFPLAGDAQEADEQLASALYALLWSIREDDLSVDGWAYLRVIQESNESLDAVGLMTLLPSGSVPIEIEVRGCEEGLAWSAKIARLDAAWLSLSDSKRWNKVYIYATGEREPPKWTWGRQYHGSVHRADA